MNAQRPRLVGTIEQREGAFGIACGATLFYPLEGNSGLAEDFRESFGEAGRHDIGKRLYNNRGTLQMENTEQRERREANEGNL